jgi:hypothetical protein
MCPFSGNALSTANRSLLAARLKKQHVSVRGSTSPTPSISPSETYRVLGVELNTTFNLIKHWHDLKRRTASLINSLSTSLLTQSRRIRVIRSLLIGKHLTLHLGLFSDSQMDTLDGQICTALRTVVSSVRTLPRTALHCSTTDLGYGSLSLKAQSAQFTVYHIHKIINTPGYRGHMARSHIQTISTLYNH